jgi:hypothetical protein
MIEVFGIEAVKNFCLCNVWKYRYRAADKNGEEDLDKSDWYMNKYIELQKREKKDTSPEKKDTSPIVINYPTTPVSVPTEPLPWNQPWYLTPPYEITCNTNQVKND